MSEIWETLLKNFFNHADTNGDGKWTVEEMKATFPEQEHPVAEKIFARHDKDGDKTVTFEEFRATFAKTLTEQRLSRLPIMCWCKVMDKDGDRKLNLEEMKNVLAGVWNTPVTEEETEVFRATTLKVDFPVAFSDFAPLVVEDLKRALLRYREIILQQAL